LWSQIVQEKINRIKIKLVQDKNFSTKSLEKLTQHLRLLLGRESIIEVEYLPKNILPTLLTQKHKAVISNIPTDKPQSY